MIEYRKAQKILANSKIKIQNEVIFTKNSLNRVSAKNVFSSTNYPSCNNTAFDGYAVNSKETIGLNNNNKKKFIILKTIAAGDNPKINKIIKYSAIEVMTGAIIQKPFDTIIPIEDIEFFPNKIIQKYIILKKKIKKNNYIRFAGSDYKKGDKIINKGETIQASHILAFKTLGIEKILVKEKPKIIFYATGNEISNNNKIPDWKVRNSNSHYLKSIAKNIPVIFKEKKIIRDDDQIKFKREMINNLKSKSDIVITSGAVSKGKYDFVPNIIRFFELKSSFKNVSIRPGKPIMFAKFKKNMCFFGLPGNPISSAACFRFFVYPYLLKILGMKIEKPFRARLKNSFNKKRKFTRFLECKITSTNNGNLEVEVLRGQESFRVKTLVRSNVWGVFKSGQAIFKKGQIIDCYSQIGLNNNILL